MFFALLKLVAPPDELAEWEDKYRSGGVGPIARPRNALLS